MIIKKLIKAAPHCFPGPCEARFSTKIKGLEAEDVARAFCLLTCYETNKHANSLWTLELEGNRLKMNAVVPSFLTMDDWEGREWDVVRTQGERRDRERQKSDRH